MLKAAMVAHGGPSDDRSLRAIGHDLIKALESAEDAGFVSNAPNLRAILEVLQEPFKQHWFRYGRPEQFKLPGDFDAVLVTLDVLDEELRALLWDE